MDKICELAKQSSDTLEGLEKGADVAICGMMTGLQRRRNKEGKPWAMFQLEDKLGAVECMVFTTTYEQVLPMLADDKAVLIRGMALPEEGAANQGVREGHHSAGSRPGADAVADFDQGPARVRTVPTRPKRSERYSSASPAKRLSGCGSKGRRTSRLFWM